MAGVDKVIVTNMGALKSKYGGQVRGIKRALRDLVSADKQRGLTTHVVALDNPAEMAKLNAKAVEKAYDPQEVKGAVDGVFAALRSPYLMILGAIDIVPHQPLQNPAFSPRDGNLIAFGDLPYACDAPYSLSIKDFVGPTRVVGRLPDVTGSSDPRYLEGLLGLLCTAISRGPQPAPGADQCLAISTWSYRHLTSRVLASLFPPPATPFLSTSPNDGPYWPGAALRSPIHYINCHGNDGDCRFYGERSADDEGEDNFPIAHDSGCIVNRLATGTVAAAGCCYGAQLYDPRACGGVAGICNTYLASGAYAFFGSSTVAYGGNFDGAHDDSTTPNDWADLLCQYFLRHVLNGSSVGAATLRARQDFVEYIAQPPDPFGPLDLKTLAQFSLMGDPSLHPFLPQSVGEAAPSASAAGEASTFERAAAERAERRARSAARGEKLRRSTVVAHRPIKAADADSTISQILGRAGVTDWTRPGLRSFAVSAAESSQGAPLALTGQSCVHVVTRRGKRRKAPFPIIELIIATEVDGKIASLRRASSR